MEFEEFNEVGRVSSTRRRREPYERERSRVESRGGKVDEEIDLGQEEERVGFR